ncbi:hypothetical protein [Desulfobacula phenolica]|uniref:Uncharacterized protein n=1 Tax=Desulfobacula phenolica TaxID=90732 RepID=A0A1H2J4C9_9BACT|nr:hypothetical protein [Desulfobacula phenolica]SDU51313.1 hypothetical protein SAMN04487931_110171 [Desulfobacula phenolica]
MYSTTIYDTLRNDLEEKVISHNLVNESINIKCKRLLPRQAIGRHKHDYYSIIKGKKFMVEADFLQVKGQGFTDAFENRAYNIKDILSMNRSTKRNRVSFVAGLNAAYRYLGLTDKTIY